LSGDAEPPPFLSRGGEAGLLYIYMLLLPPLALLIQKGNEHLGVFGHQAADWTRSVGNTENLAVRTKNEGRGLNNVALLLVPGTQGLCGLGTVQPIKDRKSEVEFINGTFSLVQGVGRERADLGSHSFQGFKAVLEVS
jgi:hypothetical protein